MENDEPLLPDELPPENTGAGSQVEELERMLELPTPCGQCSAYKDMLEILLKENTELHAKVMEAELSAELAKDMLPAHIQKFLVDQANAAERLRKAKELAEQQAALSQIQGMTPPVPMSYPAPRRTAPVAAIPAPNAPAGKLIDYRGVAVAIPNTITAPSQSWIIPFGKYRGRMLIEIESGYLTWCLQQDWLRPEPRGHMTNVLVERGVIRQKP